MAERTPPPSAGPNGAATVDPRIVSAAAHWSHRFISNGVPLADFQDVTGTITRWDDWCSAWSVRGDVHRALGDAALDGGHRLSAGEHYSTAAVCYHFGKFLFVHDRDQMRAAGTRAVDARQRALALIDPPGERLEVAWNGHVLPGILRKPARVSRPPVVIMVMGLDSAKEEMATNEAVFLNRGLATFSFDGPGQGEAEYDLPIHPAYEEPVAAVVDHLALRTDIDGDRMAVWGVSLGGYYAPRAAAFVDRLRACVSLTGPFDFAEAFDRAPPLTRQAFIARSFAPDADAARVVAARMTLEGVAGRIRCPIYIVGAALDRVLPPDHAARLAESTGDRAILNIIEDGTHVANNRPYKYRTQVGDWLAEVLRR